jgi:hypothetical protein
LVQVLPAFLIRILDTPLLLGRGSVASSVSRTVLSLVKARPPSMVTLPVALVSSWKDAPR